MKIAFNNIPLKSAHKDRGIGFYTHNLIENLKKDSQIRLQEFADINDVKDADLIHYPWFDFFFRSLKLKKIPTVVTIHDAMPLRFKEHYPVGIRGRINFFLQKRALKKCSVVITDSEASKKDIVNFLKINEDKVTVVPLAVSNNFKVLTDNRLIFIKRKYNLPDQFLLYVGDANWVKNLPFLVEGFNQIVKDEKFNKLKLVLVGGVFLKKVEDINHPELESLKKTNKLIEEFNLQDKIIRPGNLTEEDLVAFYNLSTIYVQPSIYEGFGLPVLQALSCGTPVISSKGGSLPEVGGEAVLYFNPTNINQFVSLVKEILEDRSLQAKLSKLGLKQAQKFSWFRVVEETKKVYRKVLRHE